MYRCQVCNGNFAGQSYKRITQRRERIYSFRKNVNSCIKDGQRKKTDDPGGKGWEIVTEITVCAAHKGE